MDAEPLTAARAQYEADGFYLHQQALIATALLNRAVEGMDAVRAGDYDTGMPPMGGSKPGDDPRKLCKIENPQVANRAILELVSQSAIGAVAAAVSEARMVQVWWVQLLGKPPVDPDFEAPTNIGWHQDRQYWGRWEKGSELFTAWVALSDVTADSGPMRFVRGSHRWGLLDQGNFHGQDHEAQRQAIAVPEGETWREVPAILPPGGVSFHHNLTYHGSGLNQSADMRRSLAIHLRTENSTPSAEANDEQATMLDDPARCPVVYGSNN